MIEEVTSVNLPPVAIIGSSAVEGSAPFEIAFNGSSSTGTGELIYNWNFGDGGSSELANPDHLFEEAGTYNVVLTVMDSMAVMDKDTLEINIWEEAPVWSMILNAGSAVNTSYQGKLFLGDNAFPELYNSTKTYSNSSSSNVEIFQTDRYGKNLAYAIPVDNGTYRVRTFHNELWFGQGGPTGQPGQRVFDIMIEDSLVRDNFDLYLESNYEETELIFEDIQVTDGELNLTFIASANNASVSGIILERVEPKDGEGSSLRIMNAGTSDSDANEEDSVEDLLKFRLSKAIIYPNPAINEAFIRLPESSSAVWINIYDLNGRQVMNFNVSNEVTNEYTIPVSRLKQGVYMVRLLGDEGVIEQLRLIINR